MEKEIKKTSGCNACKKRKNLKPSELALIFLAFYMFFTSIYGTIQLFKNIF